MHFLLGLARNSGSGPDPMLIGPQPPPNGHCRHKRSPL